MKFLVDIPWFYREPLNGMFPWLRDLEVRNTLLKPEWREKVRFSWLC